MGHAFSKLETLMEQQQGTTTMELQLISAKGLKKVETLIDVYAVVSIDDGIHGRKQTTATTLVKKCGTNPTFNYTMHFTLDKALLHSYLPSLRIQLVRRRHVIPDRIMSEFHVPLKQLYDLANPKGRKIITSCKVWRFFSRRGKGELSFSYYFGDRLLNAPAKKVQPVASYASRDFVNAFNKFRKTCRSIVAFV